MFGPQLDIPADPPQPITTFEQQYAPPGEGAITTPDGRFSVALNLTLTSDYDFRGIVQRHDRASVQPGAEVAYRLGEHEGLGASLFAGMWADVRLHDIAGGGSLGDRFYELDLYAGVEVTWGRLAARATFTEYLSPAGDFPRVHELSLGATFDDGGLYGGRLARFSVNPSALVAFEIGPDGADGGGAGVFLALGVEPAVELGRTRVGEVTLSAPVEVGLSLSDYYETPAGDETLGYVRVGARVAIDPGGAWPELTLGADYVELGDGGEALAGRGSEVTLSMDLAWSF